MQYLIVILSVLAVLAAGSFTYWYFVIRPRHDSKNDPHRVNIGKVVMTGKTIPEIILVNDPNPFPANISVPEGKAVLLAIDDLDKLSKASQLIKEK